MLARLVRVAMIVVLLPCIAAAAVLFLVLELARACWRGPSRRLSDEDAYNQTFFPNRLP
jgi:hypothetical protein